MAYAGQILDNPVSGERLEFLQTAADTNGELLELELTLDPDGQVPGAHVHPEQEERFHVLEGTMKFRLGLRTIIGKAACGQHHRRRSALASSIRSAGCGRNRSVLIVSTDCSGGIVERVAD